MKSSGSGGEGFGDKDSKRQRSPSRWIVIWDQKRYPRLNVIGATDWPSGVHTSGVING